MGPRPCDPRPVQKCPGRGGRRSRTRARPPAPAATLVPVQGVMTTAIHLRACTFPLGAMTIAAQTGPGAPDGGELIGVWFDGQAHDRAGLPDDAAVEPGREGEIAVLSAARTWLERYFAGEDRECYDRSKRFN